MRKLKPWPEYIARVAVEKGIIEPTQEIVLGIETLYDQELTHIAHNVGKLLSLLQTIPNRCFEGNLTRMCRDYGYGDEDTKLFNAFDEPLSSDVFARADLIYSKSGWKLLEFNIGSLVGGMFQASLPSLAGFPQQNDTMRLWAQFVIEKLNLRQKSLAVIADSSFFRNSILPLRVYADALSQSHGSYVEIASSADLRWNGQEMALHGRAIDAVYCRFDEHCVKSHPQEYRALISAVQSGTVSCPMGLAYNVLANKGSLALMSKLAATDSLSRETQSLIADLLPKTYWLNEVCVEMLAAERRNWVLKPTNSHSGRGVICGRDQSDDVWRLRLVEASRQRDRSYIVQEYEEPLPAQATVSSGKGCRKYDARAVWSVYLFGRDYLGGIVRTRALCEDAVVNVGAGAAVGPLAPSLA